MEPRLAPSRVLCPADPGPAFRQGHPSWRAVTVPAGPYPMARADDSLAAEVIERLVGTFGGSARAHAAICGVVSGCVADLTSSPRTALPELLERLAHQRLLEMAPRFAFLRDVRAD